MQLTAIAWREGDPTHHTVENDNTLLVTVGFLHDATNQVLLITAHPDGQLTMSYGKVKDPAISHLLGRLSENGVLEIHEPRPL